MALYRYNEKSLIDTVTVHHSKGGGTRAYLHAREGLDPEVVNRLKDLLTAHNMQATPIEEDGKPMLEVRGVDGHVNKLLSLLDASGVVTGKPVKSALPDDKISLTDRLRKHTLSLSGAFFFVGDASFARYAWKNAFHPHSFKLKNPQILAASAFYAMGTPFLVLFGRGDKSDLQLKHMSYNLIKDLKGQGVDVPKDSAARSMADGHNTTLVKKLHSSSQRYPAEITNSMFAGAGTMLIWDNAKAFREYMPEVKAQAKNGVLAVIKRLAERRRIPGQGPHAPVSILMDIGLGTMTLTAGLISVFIEEQPKKPEDKKKHGLPRLAEKIRERPLAAAGGALFGASLAHAASTVFDWSFVRKELALPLGHADRPVGQALADSINLKKAVPFRALFVATNLAAEALMFFSSKGHGAGVKSDDSLDRSAYAVGADLVHRAPSDQQEALLGKVTTFYAHRKHLASDPAVIEKGIREQLARLDDNPWTAMAVSSRAKQSPAPAQGARAEPQAIVGQHTAAAVGEGRMDTPASVLARGQQPESALARLEQAAAHRNSGQAALGVP